MDARALKFQMCKRVVFHERLTGLFDVQKGQRPSLIE
jgi:hypothetical protein